MKPYDQLNPPSAASTEDTNAESKPTNIVIL